MAGASQTVIDFLKLHLRPSSPVLALAILGFIAAWLFIRPASRKPRVFLLLVLMSYWFVSTPLGAGVLLFGLSHGVAPVTSRDQAPGVDTVVVLGGGASTYTLDDMVIGEVGPGSALRALEAARVYKLLGARQVIASGGIPFPERQVRTEAELIANALVQAGVPSSAIALESGSRTTRDQVRLVRPMILARGQKRFVLVTSAPHMGRALRLFHAAGLDPIPSVSPMHSQNRRPGPWFLPNESSLDVSNEAIYDYLAWLYYWFTGWTV